MTVELGGAFLNGSDSLAIFIAARRDAVPVADRGCDRVRAARSIRPGSQPAASEDSNEHDAAAGCHGGSHVYGGDGSPQVHAAEGVTPEQGGLRVSVMPGGCSGFKYGLVIEDKNAEDDTVFELEGIKLFVDPFSAQYLSGTTIDYVTSMQGSGFTFKNPQSTGGCGCGSSFSA